MPRTPFQFWHIHDTRPNRWTALGPMLPTGYNSMAASLLTTLPAVLIPWLWFTSFEPLTKHLAVRPCAGDTNKEQVVTSYLQTHETNFFHAKIRCWWLTTCRFGMYHHVWHMKESQNNYWQQTVCYPKLFKLLFNKNYRAATKFNSQSLIYINCTLLFM